MTPRKALSTTALLLPLILAGCGKTEQPNVLLISLDTLRADHLSSYGYERETTPFMDEVAASGVRFHWAFVNTLATTNSHTTILSSQFQESHGVMYGGKGSSENNRLPDGLPLVQESFRDAGYKHARGNGWRQLRRAPRFRPRLRRVPRQSGAGRTRTGSKEFLDMLDRESTFRTSRCSCSTTPTRSMPRTRRRRRTTLSSPPVRRASFVPTARKPAAGAGHRFAGSDRLPTSSTWCRSTMAASG